MIGRGRSARGYRSVASTLVALALLCSAAAGASGSTRSRISSARQRLSALEHEMSAARDRVAAMQTQLRVLAVKVQQGRARYDSIHSRLVATRNHLAYERARYHTIRHRLDGRARDAYMQGPGSGIDFILGASSLANLSDRVEFVNAVAQSDVDLANRAQQLAAVLKVQAAREHSELQQQASVLRALTSAERSLASSFAAEQAQMDRLARARTEVASLLRRLRNQLRAEELAAARSAIATGTPATFGGWASAFLSAAGFSQSRNNLVVMVAWQTAEYTDARWNPLATTYPMAGSSIFNSAGVRNYASLGQGIQATIDTLRASGYGYEAILSDLAASADPYTTAGAINASSWCHGCAGGNYVIGLIPAVEAYYGSYAAN